ncbi:glutathione S-transferase C-terminal domain-containing protein isoform X2 [Daktulosphaira vitifoliae]|uniref:glutathione S-transferase C-terminal domain-containing protein isoform X2 n=1 Tax=Daktulosphaira vitifoliae TaxID=58002 RepID=UPI0021AA649B|nr:glutathione S-transferase C-terminal domain-containing protein isoform X2 [Daktulosphaira vitifoliae]
MSSSLFVNIIDLDSDEKYVTCSLRTAIVLFLCQYVNSPVILVRIKNNLPKPAADCLLPVYQSNNDPYCTAGFCSSLRMLIKSLGEKFQWLLGFRQSCLSACAEVSSWTKFCEVEIHASITSLFQKNHIDSNSPYILPIQLARFERHLSQPLQVHNINKRLNKNSQHFAVRFADEENPTLSDILILPNIHIVYKILGESVFYKFLPLTWKWYKLILERLHITEALNNIIVEFYIQLPTEYLLPEVPPHSLYKCDLRRYNPHSKLYVKQNVQNILQLYDSLNIDIKNNSYNLKKINWSELPNEACPIGGDIPEKRLIRKTQQLENLIQAVFQVAKDGDVVVDFCCGSGHLGIAIAHLKPSLTVILVDNKEESLRRAKDRVEKLKLKNIMVVHSNLDYFNADFQVGVCLHGCGVATDLVLEKCILQNAAFVVCPCCYGSIQDNHILEYPRSQVLRTNLTFEDYLVLCHCADQTHFDPKCSKTLQGFSCMAAVDEDRATRAIESGYNVTLSKLIPPTCTPKNNILVGIPL